MREAGIATACNILMTEHISIRRLPRSAGPADAELAGGPALLAGVEHTDTPALRWYGMNPPALIVGSSQPLGEIDQAACAATGLDRKSTRLNSSH